MYRPTLSDEIKQEVEDLTEGYFNIPAERVAFEDRLRILTDQARKYENSDSTQTLNLENIDTKRR